MRDYLCDEKDLQETIDFQYEFIEEDKNDIRELEQDIKDGVQRYSAPPELIIRRTKGSIYREISQIIDAKYSLGEECSLLEELYFDGIPYIEAIEYEALGYVNILQYVTLGILLEISHDEMQKLVDVIDNAKVDDLLFDFFANAYDLERKIKSTKFQKKKPYFRVIEIVEMASKDKKVASRMLKDYVEKEWLKGHSDYGWTTFHKEPGYCGLWSYEAAALAKILKLDDASLRENNHYPYDLAHYKHGIDFSNVQMDYAVKEEVENYIEGIVANKTLETLIPKKYHQCVSQLIADYNSMDDKVLWEKYGLNQVWFELEEFSKDKKTGLLGTLIVFELVEQGYILQLDYKEDLEDYVDVIENYWGQEDTKLIEFIIDNDQQYFARVPQNTSLVDIYEVKVAEV